MLKNKFDKFDERQLYLRGNAFKHGFIIMALLLFISAFVKSVILDNESAVFVEGAWGNILIVIISAAVCMIELIVRDAMNYEDSLNNFIIYVLGILGFILIIWGSIDLIVSKGGIIKGYTLTAEGAKLLMNCAWIVVGIVYVVKKRKMKYSD